MREIGSHSLGTRHLNYKYFIVDCLDHFIKLFIVKQKKKITKLKQNIHF